MPYELKPRMLFCDWHMPAFLPEVKIDYDEYFAQIERTGAQCLIFQVKTAHGAAFAPTEVGVTNPSMTGDLFGEISRRAKALGLEFIAYYNMILSWELHRTHPEWEQIGRDGKPLRMFLYPAFCMSNDEFAAHVQAHMAEVTARYPIDGWFLDLQYFSPEGCFCASCRARFKAQCGYDLVPDGFGPEQWLDLLDYQVRTREAFIHAAMDRCNQEKPGLSWSWNGSGSPHSISATLHDRADYLSTEAHPPAYLHAEHATRYCRSLDRPFTLFMPESQGSWGDWTVTTPATIKGLSAIALAQGGSLNINHVPYPCGDHGGRVPQVIWDTITGAFEFVAARERYCMGKRPVPVAAVLRSAANARMLQALSRAGRGGHFGGATYGNEHAVAQLLLEAHIPWEIRPETMPPEEMAQYELIILPYLPYVDDDLADRLRVYVQEGGKLLAGHHTSLFDAKGEPLDNFSLADLLGVDYIEESPYSITYLDAFEEPFRPQVPDMPLLVKDVASGRMNPQNRALHCRPHPGARVLCRLTEPVIESDFESGHYVYHDHAPPGALTPHPGLTLHAVGKGQAACLPAPFFTGYARSKCPFLQEVFRTLVGGLMGVSQRIRVSAPRSVKVSLMQDQEGWLLHLVHIQMASDSMYLDSFTRPEPITVRANPGWGVKSARDCLGEEELPLRPDGDAVEFTVPGVRDHVIVRLQR